MGSYRATPRTLPPRSYPSLSCFLSQQRVKADFWSCSLNSPCEVPFLEGNLKLNYVSLSKAGTRVENCQLFGKFPVLEGPSQHRPVPMLYRFHQWQANLRVLGVRQIKTLPYVPLSHPFAERL